jgi:hypothetical protein
LDYELSHGYDVENLKLLYRPTAADPWRVVHTTQSGSPVAGYLKTDFLASGQYAMAVGSPSAAIADRNQVKLYLYPNPSRGNLLIRVSEPEFAGRVEIVDAVGRVVKRLKMDGNELRVNTSRFPAGIYYVRVIGPDGADTVRFVKY